jgi:hypothetical protein
MPDSLYRDLQSLSIGSPQERLSFAARLARDNSWAPEFAERVLAEYRRFLWLLVRSRHPVTPPVAVDAAWHLHLCYTRSYWDDLCGQIVGRPLHHEPTRGGAAETRKFRGWYGATLASYRRHFGEPPADIWPDVATRFAPIAVQRVDRSTHWIVRKTSVRAACLSIAALTAAGCAKGELELAIGLGALVLFAAGLLVWCVHQISHRVPERSSQPRERDEAQGGGTGCGAGKGADDAGGDGGGDGGSGCGSGCGGD